MIEHADKRRVVSRAELVEDMWRVGREQLERSTRRAEAALARATALRVAARTPREQRAAQAAAVRARVALCDVERDATSAAVLRRYAKRHGVRV